MRNRLKVSSAHPLKVSVILDSKPFKSALSLDPLSPGAEDIWTLVGQWN